MASVSASSLILFIAAIGIALAVSGAMVDSVSSISNSIDERSVDVSEQIDTDIEIISDTGSDAIYDDGTTTVTVLVKNTGSGTLASDDEHIDVLVDGQYVTDADLSVSVFDGSDWRENRVAELTIDQSLSNGDHRVTVIVNSEQEVLRFHV